MVLIKMCSLNKFLWTTFLIVNFSYIRAQYTKFEKDYTRKLSALKPFPSCNMDWCRNTSFTGGVITHLVATGPKDELHHLFCTIGAPTLMSSRTAIGTHVNISYEKLRSPHGAEVISYTSAPEHSFGMVFPNIYEYNDVQDTANLSDYISHPDSILLHKLTNLDWFVYNKSGDDTYQKMIVNATSSSSNHSLLNEKGYLSFTIQYDSKDGRLEGRPHMEYTANSSMVTVVMSDLKTNWPSSRFVLEMVMFSTENSSVSPAQTWNATLTNEVKSLDDEYSPGVFKMKNWHANPNKPREAAWGYAQWKPVVYTSPARLNADLSTASSYPNLAKDKKYILNVTLPSRSLFTLYFGADDTSEVSLNATNISYGITKDKFYTHTKYLTWTMSMGMGPPPEDDVSILVILVIAVGLGIPLVLMILSAVYVCVKNIRKKREVVYTPINE
ncbi:glycosylated lysosomal membrane protein A-like [Watersipora subatra]|uniref:glycosylated lysosomal membrane protein A-like n=1 Tax=Watersipora subatra TaxID=2589382 RepID=UPI00355B3E6B